MRGRTMLRVSCALLVATCAALLLTLEHVEGAPKGSSHILLVLMVLGAGGLTFLPARGAR